MSKIKPLGVGIVGTGWVATAHIDTFKEIDGCNIVAVCSRDPRRAMNKIAQHDLTQAKPYDNYEMFLNHDGLDIVVICTPHPHHPDETVAAAQAGKHIVIEKPVALDRRNLARMVAAVSQAKVITSVCFELRWMGLFRNIKKMLEQRLIGDVFYAECSYFHGIGPWYGQWSWNIKKAIGGDALLTAGCHALDSLIWCVGSEVAEVAGMSCTSPANPLKYEYDPNSVAILKFKNGAVGKVATSIECRQPYLFPVLFQGDKGTIWNDQVWSLDWPGQREWAKVPADMPDSGDVKDHPYTGQLRHFVECIHEGKRPHNDLAACAHVHEVMYAIDEAIRRKKTVAVPRTPGS